MDMKNKNKSSKEFSMPANSSMMDFFIAMYFGRNYCNFNGRASRKEYLTTSIMELFILAMPSTLLMYMLPEYSSYIELAYELLTLIPKFSLSVRRFHDINMSPYWALLIIPLAFLPFFKGDRCDNRYGKNIYLEN